MLESIHIKNFRSCDDISLRLGSPLVALVGKNGAGKTNLLHAIQLTAELCVGESDPVFHVASKVISEPAEFELEFSVADKRFSYRTARTLPVARTPVYRESLAIRSSTGMQWLYKRDGDSLVAERTSFADQLRIGPGASALSALLQVLPQSDAIYGMLAPVSAYLRAIRYYSLLQGFQEHAMERETSLIEQGRYQAWKTSLAQGKPTRSVQMRLLHMFLESKDRFDELRKLLGGNGLGLLSDIHIDTVSLPTSSKTEESSRLAYSIAFSPGEALAGAGSRFRVWGLSAGTLRVLQILTSLVFDESSCMLIEQPEDCIHSGLLARVVDILKAYAHKSQLIWTTHSPRVMNLVGPEGIRLVTASAGTTYVSELTEPELSAAQAYLADEGTLAEFLDTL